MKQKLAKLLRSVFGIGEMLLMAGALIILAIYVFAIIIGGEAAVSIEAFIYNRVFPVMFFAAIVLAFIGILYVYLTGYKTFRFDSKSKNQ